MFSTIKYKDKLRHSFLCEGEKWKGNTLISVYEKTNHKKHMSLQ